jgi:hypothetical protein
MQKEMAQRLLEKMEVTKETLSGSDSALDRGIEGLLVMTYGIDAVNKLFDIRVGSALEAYTEITAEFFTPDELDRAIGMVSSPEWAKLMDIQRLTQGQRPDSLKEIGVPVLRRVREKVIDAAEELGIYAPVKGCGDPNCPTCGPLADDDKDSSGETNES